MIPDKCYTVTQVSQQLSDILNFVEQGHSVELIRHGKPVAMVVPIAKNQTFHALAHSDFWHALQDFQQQYSDDFIDVDEVFADIREASSGRKVSW